MQGALARFYRFIHLGRAILTNGLGARAAGPLLPAVPACIETTDGQATTITISDDGATTILVADGNATAITCEGSSCSC